MSPETTRGPAAMAAMLVKIGFPAAFRFPVQKALTRPPYATSACRSPNPSSGRG